MKSWKIPRFTLVLLDCTVFPANAAYLEGALQHLATVVHFGGHCVGHVQLPMHFSNATLSAWVKHSNTVQQSLLSKKVDFSNLTTLDFRKPSDAASNDKRKSSQTCFSCVSDGDKSLWQLPGVKISEMIGWDSENKPGPSARIEQSRGQAVCILNLESLLVCC